MRFEVRVVARGFYRVRAARALFRRGKLVREPPRVGVARIGAGTGLHAWSGRVVFDETFGGTRASP